MVIKRGEIWWAELPAPHGSEPAFRRPVLILQSDRFNGSPLRTTIGVALTTNLRHADISANVFVPRRASKLPKDSVVNITQVATIDKDLLVKRVSRLPKDLTRRVEDGVRLVLGL